MDTINIFINERRTNMENKNVENVEVTEVVEVTEKVGFLTKVCNFFKDHKKGVAIGAGVAAVAGIGAVLVKAALNKNIEDVDYVELEEVDLDDLEN